MANVMKRKSDGTQQEEVNAGDMYPVEVARQRTDDLLRSLLATPPEPFTPKAKPQKRAKK